MEEKRQFTISASPHIRRSRNVREIMLWVILALTPSLGVGVWLFGLRALLVVAVSVAACVFFEWAYRRALHKSSSIGDLSAVVTGMMLGMSMSSQIPLWVPVVGAFFGIVVVKQLYGGIGKNFLNPALAARCFLFSWPVLMTVWVAPRTYANFFDLSGVDAVTTATPLSALSQGQLPEQSLWECFVGLRGGPIGEVSALALLLGGVLLLAVGVINLRIPLTYLLTVGVLVFLFPQGHERLPWMAYHLLNGGIAMGAVFMANDYATSPTTHKGQILYGIGCGALTVFIRYFGSYAEGVSFAVLIMNLTTWLIDKATLPRRYGVFPAGRQEKEAKS